MALSSLPTIKRYAQKCNAKLIAIESFDDPTLPAMYAKTKVHELLKEYEKVLFIDIDILITPRAPNLFELFASNDEIFAAVPVERFYNGVKREKNNLQAALGEINWTQPYFNSGVMLVGRSHSHILNPHDGLIQKWHKWKKDNNKTGLNDQSIFNYRVNKDCLKLTELDRRFNFTRATQDFNKRFNCYFMHYAGLRGNRTKLMQRDRMVLDNPFVLRLYAKSPLVCKIRDAIIRRTLRLH
ncbi:glycosyltransferase [Oleiphilus sp. HI0080]|uniref:glycosyltransferase n=1 Tax=Oleiphilus sp. HI0080 TaxID=1822255 RepID=UPI000838FEF4|nr:glycosyltransferase [Oleiphilus sp. HI0080]